MNIMFVAIFPMVPSIGGVQRVTEILTKEMQSRGHNIIYVAYDRKEKMSYGKFAAPQYFVEVNNRKDIEIQSELKEIVDKNHITHVICQNLGNSAFIKFLPSNLKIVTVCHTQPYPKDSITRKQILSGNVTGLPQVVFKYISYCFPIIARHYAASVENKRLQSAFDVSNKVCFISDRFYGRVTKHLPHILPSQLAAINNPNLGCNASYDEACKENIVLWVGRVYDSTKNTIDFVKAWEIVSKDYPDWKAWVVGDGKSVNSNKEYILEHNIQNIEYLGRREDVFDLYKKSKIAAVTSWSESWCMVVIEAMTNGCVPVVYDTYETVRDIIDNNQDGIICVPTPTDLASKISQLITDENKRQVIAQNAVTKVDKFSVSKIVDQWEQLLNSL